MIDRHLESPRVRRFVREVVGEILGWMSAPIFASFSAARHARSLHPRGLVFDASVEAAGAPEAAGSIGRRLAGPALVRFSAALWKHARALPDVLGCAVRLLAPPAGAPSGHDEQDLLFATVRSPWTMGAAPFFTDVRDFLANDYFATAPFDVAGLGRAKFKLEPEGPRAAGEDRDERLRRAVEAGGAALVIRVRATWTARYETVARVRLLRPAAVDEEALRFDPFRTGRGILPRGFVQSLRRGAYSGSQAGRPGTARRNITET